MSYCLDCGSRVCGCKIEADAMLMRDRTEAREGGQIHPVDVSYKVREHPGFGVVPLGFKR